MKRAALHELIEFVTATAAGSSNNNNNGQSKDKDNGQQQSDNKNSSSDEQPNLSMISAGFEQTFYEEMVNTVSGSNPILFIGTDGRILDHVFIFFNPVVLIQSSFPCPR